MDDFALASDTRAPRRGAEPPARLDQIAARLTKLRALFAQHVAAASTDWTYHVTDQAQLAGMREHDKSRARHDATQRQLDGFLLTLETRSCEAALNHLDERKLRHTLYEAYVTRASDQGPRKGKFDNSPVVQEMLALRHELAVLHGYENYAEYALRDSLLTSARDVERYLLTDGEQLRARAQAELDQIWTFAKAKGAAKGFATWDLGYYAASLARERLAFCTDELRSYFSFPDVLSGLFALCERLLGVGMVLLIGDDSGRESVLYKVVTDAGEELAWLEIEPRPPAHQGAGPRVTLSEEPEADGDGPVLRVRLDLDRVDDGEAVLLTHADISSLFGCLGQGLFLLLTRARGPRTAALQHAHATASEVAGCYFEHFCAQFELLATFARHHVTGASLPRELFDKLLQRRAMHEGLAAAQELEQALFDLRVHRDFVPPDKATQLRQHVFDTLAQVRQEVCVLRPPFWDKSVNTNSALFVEDGGLRAWESVWARRAAIPLFAAFAGAPFDVAVARRLRDTFWAANEAGVLERLTEALGSRPLLLKSADSRQEA